MTTKTIYERVAEKHHTTPEEVELEMRKALEAANIDMEPEVFIGTVAQQILGYPGI